MKRIFYLLFSVILISCEKQDVFEPKQNSQETVEVGGKQQSVKRDDAIKLATILADGIFNDYNQTRANVRDVQSIAPIVDGNDTLIWVINYRDNQGYIVLSAKQDRFPILSFNNEGNFNTIDTANVWIKEQMSNIKYSNQGLSSDTIHTSFWADLISPEEDEEILFEIVDNESLSISTRAIPERENPLNRQMVFPMCYPTQWGTGFGYNYEAPLQTYSLWGRCKGEVNELVVSIAHIMSYHWAPSNYGWMYMPYTIEQKKENDKPNLVASLFKDLGEELGLVYNNSGAYLSPWVVFNLPSFFKHMGYSSGGNLFMYNDDESSFQRVYSSLLNWRPVLGAILWTPTPFTIQNDRIYDAFVIDGYQEVKVKVTKKKKVMGITVSTKVYYYYGDYFRFLYPDAGRFSSSGPDVVGGYKSGWYQQDHYKTGGPDTGYKKYMILDIRP